jgi:ribosome-associated translation inhibitor RaiA
MHIDIQARGFTLTESLRDHCERRMRFALGPASGRLRGIAVRLADDNGPRGGVDKRCTIRATLPGTPAIVIEHNEMNMYAAIACAAERFARTLSRLLHRTGRKHRARATLPFNETEAELPNAAPAGPSRQTRMRTAGEADV